MRKMSWLLLVPIAAITFTNAGCERKKTVGEKVEDKIDSAGDKVGDAVDKAVDKADDAVDKAKGK